jgi:uncharacterized membrane protein YidH (DUF202 family)
MKLGKNLLISYARLCRADKKMQGSTETKRAVIGFIISLLAGLLVLIQGIVRLVRAEWALDFGFGEIPRRLFGETFLTTRGIFAVVFGIMVLLGAFLIYRPGKENGRRHTCSRILCNEHHRRRRLPCGIRSRSDRRSPWISQEIDRRLFPVSIFVLFENA